MATRIILENGSYLECNDAVVFPIDLKVGDIKDISKRTTSHSKSIKLIGSDNNIKVLGNLFDVNVIDSTFNINKRIKVQVEQNGVIVFDNAYFQLRHVIKTGKQGVRTTNGIEFEGLVFKSTYDFFTEINDREVSDLRINTPDTTHVLNRNNIINSWDNDWEDGYVYPTYYKDQVELNGAFVDANVYRVDEFKPAIFGRKIWDAIHESAGFTYDWDSIDDDDINFSRLIYPFNSQYTVSAEEKANFTVELGTDLNPDPNDSTPAEEDFPQVEYSPASGFSANGYFFMNNPAGTIGTLVNANEPLAVSPISIPDSFFTPAMHTFTNVLKDNENQYSGGVFTPSQNGEVDIFINMGTWEINIETLGASELFSNMNDNSKWIQYKFAPFVRVKPINGPPYVNYFYSAEFMSRTFYYGDQLASGNNISTGSFTGKITVDLKAGDTIELLGVAMLVSSVDLSGSDWLMWGLQSGGFTNVTPKFRAFDVNVQIVPQLDYKEGLNINLDRFLPKKYKQSDFIKDVCNMFNLMAIPDEEKDNNIIYIKRDEYYDSGEVKDLSEYVDNSKDKTIKFLPEVNAKRITLTYSNDNDEFNELYQNTLNKTYGQLSFVLENEYVKGEERRELKLAPTPCGKMRAFGGYAPFIPTDIQKDIKPRVLYWIGKKAVSWFYIEEANGDITPTTHYGLAHHFNDPENPSFDLNYGVCDFYFHDGITLTINNLFNLHYRRTMKQINEGKLMKLHMVLPERIKANLKLNDKIYINNSAWHINHLSFNANSDEVIAELFSIDNETKTAPVVRDSSNLYDDPILSGGGSQLYPPIEGRPPEGNEFGGKGGNTFGGYNDGADVRGEANYIGSGVKAPIIYGNDNTVMESKSTTVGDGLVVTKQGLNAENIIVHNKLEFSDNREVLAPLVYEVTLDRDDIVGLHSDSIVITAEDLGIKGLGYAVPMEVICKVFTDGSNFTNNRQILISNEMGGFPAPYNIQVINNLTLDGVHYYRWNLDGRPIPMNEGFNIYPSGAIGGGGDDAFINIKIYYKIIH